MMMVFVKKMILSLFRLLHGFLSCCFEVEDKKHSIKVHFSNDNNSTSARHTAEP